MNQKTLLRALLAGALLTTGALSQAQETFGGWLFSLERMKEVRPVVNKAYQRECSECHLAYQPGLLPSRSWDQLLTADALRQHFGVSAEVDATVLSEIRGYALANGADKSYYKRARKIAAATAAGPAPLRISQLPTIQRTHAGIPAQRIVGNADVKSLAQCDKCHAQAAQGVYDNDTVAIPNFPR
jgi:hypothetical protein